MERILREMSIRFAHELSEYDKGYRHRNRKELREALVQYWNQELSAYLDNFIQTDAGEHMLNGVVHRYNLPSPVISVRYGTSGYHK